MYAACDSIILRRFFRHETQPYRQPQPLADLSYMEVVGDNFLRNNFFVKKYVQTKLVRTWYAFDGQFRTICHIVIHVPRVYYCTDVNVLERKFRYQTASTTTAIRKNVHYSTPGIPGVLV